MPAHSHFSPQLESQHVCVRLVQPPLGLTPASPDPGFDPSHRAVFSPLPAGVDTMASYEEVLRLLRYRNWHTQSLLDRKFKLICSELNGRYVSNEFQVEVGDWVPTCGPDICKHRF